MQNILELELIDTFVDALKASTYLHNLNSYIGDITLYASERCELLDFEQRTILGITGPLLRCCGISPSYCRDYPVLRDIVGQPNTKYLELVFIDKYIKVYTKLR